MRYKIKPRHHDQSWDERPEPFNYCQCTHIMEMHRVALCYIKDHHMQNSGCGYCERCKGFIAYKKDY